MNIVGVSRIHNSSVAIVQDGELIFHQENERLSNIKYDAYPFHLINKLPTLISHADTVALAGTGKTVPVECFTDHDVYTTAIKRLNKDFLNASTEVYDLWDSHHLLHAAHAFYNSGFDNAVCIIKDGMGSDYPINNDKFIKGTYGRENGSVYTASYPSKFVQVSKDVIVPFDVDEVIDNVRINNSVSEALAFQKTAKFFGFHELDAGKVMGMASYGKDDPNLPPIYIDDKINTDLFTMKDNDVRTVYVNVKNYPYLDTDDFQIKANFARKLQLLTQEKIKYDIINAVKETGIKNICLSGGYFLNCVANYHFLEDMPDDVNVYVEPVSSDAGTSIGAAKLLWYRLTEDKTKRPIKNVYNGFNQTVSKEYIETNCKDYNVQIATEKDIAILLSKRKTVALYQGRSESGPRALGNRSILYDPTDPNGKDHVNKIKNREWFRPFAGTVLLDEAKDWFDLRNLKESPFMMFAVNILKEKQKVIPAISHVDGTCRIQTITKDQNKKYFNIINEFKNITSVPILFNTSFNLAGDCIVETIDQAIDTFKNSDLDCLYFADINLLVSKNEE